MSDDWSLKDKGLKSYPDGEPTKIYSGEVIETLRQKLIGYIDNYGLYDCHRKNIIYNINKLFGVEE